MEQRRAPPRIITTLDRNSEVAESYLDVWGREKRIDPETRERLAKALGPERKPAKFDRFAPPSGRLTGRILMAKDFDAILGTGMKVYMNVGSNQGVKLGSYFRAARPYSDDAHDPVDSLSFKASIGEDTQKKQPSYGHHLLMRSTGPTIEVSDLPRRGVGEIVVIGVTPTTSTGMITFALEDIHIGDDVELDGEQQ